MGKQQTSSILDVTHQFRSFNSFALLSFIAIVAFSTFFHVYVIYTTKNGKLRNDVLIEEIVKSFSIIGKFGYFSALIGVLMKLLRI